MDAATGTADLGISTNDVGPPPKEPRRRNVLLLRGYDAPFYRDPLAWWTAFIAVSAFFALLTSTTPRQIPLWIDVALGTVVLTVLFAVVPAILRLQVRRWLWRRSRRSSGTYSSASAEQVTSRDTPQDPLSVQPQDGVQHRGSSTDPRIAVEDRSNAPVPRRPAARAGYVVPATPADDTMGGLTSFDSFRELQFPIARAVRALQRALTPRERYDALLDTADALTITLGVSAASWLRHTGADSDSLRCLRSAFATGISQGTWHDTTHRASKLDRAESGMPGLTSFSRPPRRKQPSLHTELSALTKERNLWAHGSGPRSGIDAQARLEELIPLLESALGKASEVLSKTPWLLTVTSSYKARSQHFDVSTLQVMGDHPEFARDRLTSVAPLSDGCLFMHIGEDDFVDLTPFVVYRDCLECGHSEVFYADRRTSGGVVLKSFARGHRMEDPTLVDEVDLLVQGS